MTAAPYDAARDSRESYDLAIKELRRAHVLAGLAAPRDDEERGWKENWMMADLMERLMAAKEGSRELDGDIAEAIQPNDLTRAQAAHCNTLRRQTPQKGYLPVDRAEWCRTGPTHFSWRAPNYTTSIDDAVRWVVPEGHAVDLAICTEMGSVARVYFGPIRENSAGEPLGRAATPALALCIAGLKARELGDG